MEKGVQARDHQGGGTALNCSPNPDLSFHEVFFYASITQDVKDLIEMGMLYNNGKDKQGRPIVMVKFKYAASHLPFSPGREHVVYASAMS